LRQRSDAQAVFSDIGKKRQVERDKLMELGQVTGGQIAVPCVALGLLEFMPWVIEKEGVGAGIDWPEKQEDLGRCNDIPAMQMR
jgi:hypothetical protein